MRQDDLSHRVPGFDLGVSVAEVSGVDAVDRVGSCAADTARVCEFRDSLQDVALVFHVPAVHGLGEREFPMPGERLSFEGEEVQVNGVIDGDYLAERAHDVDEEFHEPSGVRAERVVHPCGASAVTWSAKSSAEWSTTWSAPMVVAQSRDSSRDVVAITVSSVSCFAS